MMTLGTDLSGKPFPLNLDRLLTTKLLIQGASGSGKSRTIRRILEVTFGHVQHIVIDIEGDFHTLREKFDYVLAAHEGGDCPADPESADLLARRIMELGVSIIIDIYELSPEDRVEFVERFIRSLMSAPKSMWHPALIVIDEAQRLAPETGSKEAKGCLEAIKDLQGRGRKRGFCPIIATLRISELDKTVAAECQNKLIGRTSLDVDRARAGKELGFIGNDTLKLRQLNIGEFYAYGPALSNDVTQVKVGDVITTHPKPGQRSTVQTATPAKIKAVLGQLANIPKEAEAEIKDKEHLEARVRQLESELRKSNTQRPVPVEPKTVEVSVLTDEDRVFVRQSVEAYRDFTERVLSAASDAKQFAAEVSTILAKVQTHKPAPPLHRPAAPSHQRPAPVHKTPRVAHSSTTSQLSGPEQRILDAIAWLESIGVDSPEQTAVAFLAGYTIGGGAFNNPRGALRTKGLVEYAGDSIRLTAAGRGLANVPEAQLTTASLQASVLLRLPGPEQKLLKVLLDHHPHALTNEDLAQQSGYAHGGGAYNNPRGRLRTLGLIEYQGGKVRARDILFLDH